MNLKGRKLFTIQVITDLVELDVLKETKVIKYTI